jgi:perosamine synthetase
MKLLFQTMKYHIYTPDISNYMGSLREAIDSGWFSSQGEFLEKATEVCKRRIDTPYVVLLNNGTSATHMLYKALRYRYPHCTKIYVPNYVFVAVWNCALYEYSADQLEVLKTDPLTLNMCVDEDYIRSLESNSAVVIVHNVGNVINVPRLQRLRPDLVFIEDCCESFLETYEGRTTGTSGLCGAVSFFANKIVTTGEGGLWYTHDEELYQYIFKSAHHGMTAERYVYDVLGYNYRMTNLQAALLYDQMVDIDTILAKKRRIYSRYRTLLGDAVVTRGLWMCVVRLPGLRERFTKAGIDTRPMFYGIHTHAHLRSIVSVPPDTIAHSDIFMLPSSPSLTAFDQVYIALASRKPGELDIIHADESRLSEFITNDIPSTFRYFRTRNATDCLKSNALTLLGLVDDVPVAYGHIDTSWIGLCVLPTHQSRGYGAFLLDFLIAYARIAPLDFLRLSVDRTNSRASELYMRRGFRITETTDTAYLMRLVMDT